MANIIGGIGTSHVPTIAGAYDRKKQDDPDWIPLFKGYEPVKAWLAAKKPDVLVFFYNDHASTFFFDHYPTFALGVSDEFPIADEGLGQRAIPPLKEATVRDTYIRNHSEALRSIAEVGGQYKFVSFISGG